MKNEISTRKEIVDKKLGQASWDVDNRVQVLLEYDMSLFYWRPVFVKVF